jgi:4-hydroxybenzoate polyprenyltransferase
MRPKQWTKNVLVLAAFFFALGDQNQALELTAFWKVLGAAFLFCLLSSAVYLMNDVHDVEKDKAHPTKCRRPIAAGDLSIPIALTASAVLMVIAIGGSLVLSQYMFCVALCYMAVQVIYTYGLKQVALVDLFVIAAGFVLRAMAGAVVIRVEISPWLLLCTMLLALFLALCKRRHEKVVLASDGATRDSLAAYDERLLDQLISIVGAATVVFYALYTLWPDTVEKFGSRGLGFTIPFVVFGLFRYLDLVYRQEKGGQPEKILLTDIPLIVDMLLYGACVLAVIFLV